MKIKIARHYGLCGGVKRALNIVEEALKECNGEILYIFHEIVHNTFVINELKKKNIIFTDSLDSVPDGAKIVFSAHGVSRAVEDKSREKNLRIFDATCLLVKKNHDIVAQAFAEKKRVVFIGIKSHPECIGTIGRVDDGYCLVVENEDDIKNMPDIDGEVVSLSQTTLAIDDTEKIRKSLSRKYPQIKHENGICSSTSLRQQSVRELAMECDLILVIGSKTSSNSCRLLQIAKNCGSEAKLVDSVEDIKDFDFSGVSCAGITAGASTPQEQIDEIINFVRMK